MKKYSRRLFRLWPALAFAMMFAGVAMAQQAAATGSQGDMTRSVALIVANLTPILVAVLKRIAPAEILPFLAPLIGAIGTVAINFFTGTFVDPVIGTLAGSAGVGVREAVDQGKKVVGWRRASSPGVR